jgi:hypothetical protein
MRPPARLFARLLAVLTAIGVIGGALGGCGSSSSPDGTGTRAAAGDADGAWGVAAVSQAGRNGPVNIMRCTAGGDPACAVIDGARGPIRQLAMEDGGPLFAGSFPGDILRCDPFQPTSCDAVGKVPGATAVAALARSTDDDVASVYVGTTVGYQGANGEIWRCPQRDPNGTCSIVARPTPPRFVASLAITGAGVFAGLDDGRILRCTTGAGTSTCTTFARLSGGITALSAFRSMLGVATDDGVALTCPTAGSDAGSCEEIASMPGARATAVEIYGETVYAGFALAQPDARGLSGAVMACEVGSACTPVELPAPVADPGEGDPSAAPVTALVAASDDTLWVGQGTIDPARAEGALSMCPMGGACVTKWSDPAAGITAMAELPAR